MRHVLESLARRWLNLHKEIKVHTRALKNLTRVAAPDLVAAFGVGFDTAAEMPVTAGDNTDRIRSEAAFAKLCGACPTSPPRQVRATATGSIAVGTAKPTPCSTES